GTALTKPQPGAAASPACRGSSVVLVTVRPPGLAAVVPADAAVAAVAPTSPRVTVAAAMARSGRLRIMLPFRSGITGADHKPRRRPTVMATPARSPFSRRTWGAPGPGLGRV